MAGPRYAVSRHAGSREANKVDSFIGIDLAIAKGKRLPVALCCWESGRLVPKAIAAPDAPPPPRGAGNIGVLDRTQVLRFADDTAIYLRDLESHFNVRIRRVAIDAPSDPRGETAPRREAERELDRRRISCFTTPSATEFSAILLKAKEHLLAGGRQATFPHANQLWMHAGFALFERLRLEWECLEVFPQATASVLCAGSTHKSKPGGVEAQLRAAAQHTGWPKDCVRNVFKGIVWGAAHDGLDAYLAAWVAALEPTDRTPLGCPPDDVVWIPTVA